MRNTTSLFVKGPVRGVVYIDNDDTDLTLDNKHLNCNKQSIDHSLTESDLIDDQLTNRLMVETDEIHGSDANNHIIDQSHEMSKNHSNKHIDQSSSDMTYQSSDQHMEPSVHDGNDAISFIDSPHHSDVALNHLTVETTDRTNVSRLSDRSIVLEPKNQSRSSISPTSPLSNDKPIHPFFNTFLSPSHQRQTPKSSKRKTPTSSRSTPVTTNDLSPNRRSSRFRKVVDRFSPSHPSTPKARAEKVAYEEVPLIERYPFKTVDVAVTWKLDGDVVHSAADVPYINRLTRAELLNEPVSPQVDIPSDSLLNDAKVAEFNRRVEQNAIKRIEEKYGEFECNFDNIDDFDTADMEAEFAQTMSQPLLDMSIDPMRELRDLIDWDPRPDRFAYLYPPVAADLHLDELDEHEANDIRDGLENDDHVVSFRNALVAMIDRSTSARIPNNWKPRLLQSILTRKVDLDLVIDVHDATVRTSQAQPIFFALTDTDVMLIRKLIGLVKPSQDKFDRSFNNCVKAIAVLDMLTCQLPVTAAEDPALRPMVLSLCNLLTVISGLQFDEPTFKKLKNDLAAKLESWSSQLKKPIDIDA